MPYVNSADAAFARQAVLDARDLERMEAAHARTGVVRGLAVTSNANTSVAVSSGAVVLRGRQAPVTAANASLALTVDGTNPRWGIVRVDGTTGTLSMLMGTAASSPVMPTVGVDDVVLAAVYVEAGDTNVAANQIVDKRVKIPGVLALPSETTWSGATDHADHFTEQPFSIDTITAWTKTIVTDTSGGGSTKRGRFASTGTGTQGANSRIWYLRKGSWSVDSEVLSLMADITHYNTANGSVGGGGQLGHVHRVQVPGDGSLAAYVVWFDITFGLTNLWNLDVWTKTSGGVESTNAAGAGNGGGQLQGPRYVLPIIECKRIGGVATFRVPMPHRVAVNDVISIAGNDIAGTLSAPVTSVTDEHITGVASGADTLQGGSGWMYAPRRMFPAWVRSQLIGTRLRVKVWSAGYSEPGWGDSRFVWDWVDTVPVGPTAPGRSGIMVNHMGANVGAISEYGYVAVQNLDATVT